MNTTKTDILTFLDLEMNQPSNSIIQIGAVVANIKTGEILEELSVIINPKEVINPEIVKLTGITQDMVNAGIPIDEAYVQLADLHKKYDSFINLVTWGGGDSVALVDQLYGSEILKTVPNPFGRRWIDAKTVYVSYCIANGLDFRGGLAKSMTKLGLKFEGTKHNAVFDARNTFYMYKKLLELIKKEVK